MGKTAPVPAWGPGVGAQVDGASDCQHVGSRDRPEYQAELIRRLSVNRESRVGLVDPVIGPVHGDERLAEIAQGGFAGPVEALFGHEDPHRPAILQSAPGMDAEVPPG